MILIVVIFAGLFSVLFVLVSLLFVQTLCAVPSMRKAPASFSDSSVDRPSVAILIPAHNEEQGVAATVQHIKSQLREHDRIVVVADNCSDATAEVARSVGAEVAERSDLQRRGKGFALDFGVQYLATHRAAESTGDSIARPPEIVIIVDADCHVYAGSIDILALAVQRSGRPAQSLDLMVAPRGSGPMKKIAEFAWMVKNFVRPLGYARLGLPCHLMGTGMAFSWSMISAANLANGHVVEDLKLGMDFARIGQPALFCPDAKVVSYFPVSSSGATTQRARWEHGHIKMIVDTAPGLLLTALRERNSALFALTLDMCVPPVALLALLIVALFLVTGGVAIIMGSVWAFDCASLLIFEFTVTIFICWIRYGRQIISFQELLIAPWYMLRKIPLYLAYFIRRQVEWIRTQRDHE